jgi:hypothetical protein
VRSGFEQVRDRGRRPFGRDQQPDRGPGIVGVVREITERRECEHVRAGDDELSHPLGPQMAVDLCPEPCAGS